MKSFLPPLFLVTICITLMLFALNYSSRTLQVSCPSLIEIPKHSQSHRFFIDVESPSDVTLTKIKTDCACVVELSVPTDLPASKVTPIEVVIDIRKIQLPCTRSFVFYTNPPLHRLAVVKAKFVAMGN